MRTYRVTYTWTKDELLKAFRRHYQSKLRLRPSIVMAVNVMAVLMAVPSVVVLATEGLRSSASTSALALIAFAVYWLFLRRRMHEWWWTINGWWWTRGFDKRPAANAVVQWEFSEEHVAQECAGLVSFRAGWKMFSKVMEASDGFLLYTYPKSLFYWLPFAAFETSEGVEKFKSIAQSRQVRYVTTTA